MTIVHEKLAGYVIEDDSVVVFGLFKSSEDAYAWAIGPDGVGFPFTIKEVWTPSQRR